MPIPRVGNPGKSEIDLNLTGENSFVAQSTGAMHQEISAMPNKGIDKQLGSPLATTPNNILAKIIAELPISDDRLSLTETCKTLFTVRKAHPELFGQQWATVPDLEDDIAYFVTEEGSLKSEFPFVQKLKLARTLSDEFPVELSYYYPALFNLLRARPAPFQVLDTLKIDLSIDSKTLSQLISALPNPKMLTTLIISDYCDTKFSKECIEAFQRLSGLTTFHLRTESRLSVPEGFFSAFPFVKYIDLQFYANIPIDDPAESVDLPEDIGSLPEIEVFRWKGGVNPTSNFFSSFREAKEVSLHFIEFGKSNLLKDIDTFENLQQVNLLVLPSAIPEGFFSPFKFAKQVHLDFWGNNDGILISLPKDIGALPNVQEFYYSGRVKQYTANFFSSFRNAEKVSLKFTNQVNSGGLPNHMDIYPNMKNFTLTGAVSNLPRNFFSALTNAVEIKIKLDNSVDMPAITDALPNLRSFTFRAPEVTKLPEEFFSSFGNVTNIFLDLPKLTSLPAEKSWSFQNVESFYLRAAISGFSFYEKNYPHERSLSICQKLKNLSLHLPDLSLLDMDMFRDLPSVEDLYLYVPKISTRDISFPPHVKRVEFIANKDIFYGISFIIRICPDLKELRLNGEFLIKNGEQVSNHQYF